MKRHDVLGILPFIAVGALGGSVLGQTLSDGPTLTTDPFNKNSMNGGIAGSADCCGDCEYAVDDGVSENSVGAGGPIVWYNYLTAQACNEVCAISVAYGSTGFPDGSPVIILVYEDPTDDNDPSDAVLLASVEGVSANTGTDTLNCYEIGPVTVSGGFFAAVVALDLGESTFPAAIDQTASQELSWAGFGFTDPQDPLADGTQGIIDSFGIPGNWLLRASASSGPDTCPEDTNDDNVVDVQDLTAVILAWGSDDEAADVNDDGTVDVQDLTAVILAWGPCPIDNDTCEDRITIFGAEATIPFTNVGAGTDDPPFDCGSDVGADVWWNYTAPADGTLTVDTCGSDFDTVLELWSGSDCPPTDLIACNDDECDLQSSLTIDVLAGDEIKIRVGGWSGATGSGVLNLLFDEDIPEPPANDDCANAEALSVGQVVVGDTTNATGGEGPGTPEDAPFCGTSVDSPGVWYTVVGNGNELTASLCNGCPDACNTTYDAKIHVYCGTCGDFGCVGGDDDGCGVGGGPSTVTFCSEADETYYILVEGWNGSTGVYELVVQNGAACDDPSCAFGNFSCDTAATISAGDSVDASTCDGLVGAPPICTGGQNPLQGQWYVYTGDGSTATVSTCSTTFNNVAFGTDVYCAGPEGAECANLECIGTTSPPCNVFFTEQDFCTIAGNLYYIHVYTIQPGGFGDCGEYTLSVTSDGVPCDDFTECDEPGCADPAANPPFLQQLTVNIPVMADIAQDADGLLYVCGITDSQPDDPDTPEVECGCIHVFQADPLMEIGTIPAPFTTNGVAGLAYDPVNNTMWCQDNELDNQRFIEIELDGTETGNVIAQPISPFNTTGLAYDPTGDGGNGSFWYVELTNDDLYEVDRSGNILSTFDQTCLDEGNGVFGNGVTVWTGVLEVLVGEIVTGDADRIVPLDPEAADPTETAGDVTGLGAVQDAGETATRGIIRNRLNDGDTMFVTARTTQLIVEIDAPDLPAPK